MLIVCFACIQLGHSARDCPVNKQDNNIKEEKKNLNSKPVKEKSNNIVSLLYIPVLLFPPQALSSALALLGNHSPGLTG